MTSHDVVSRLRRLTGEGRIGHAGTLDPSATGVLVMGFGQGTRLMGHLTQDRKSYIARVSFGRSTTTDDAEGETLEELPVPEELSDAAFAAKTLSALVGEHEQIPPAFSAISVDGKRAYARARAGEDVVLEARPITIHSAQLISVEPGDKPSWTCAFEVSKGTYIRSIARDLGASLGTAAHLSGLARTGSGAVGIGDCHPLDKLESEVQEALDAHGSLASALTPFMLDPLRALALPVVRLGDAEAERARSGARIRIADRPEIEDGADVALVHGDALIGIWTRSADTLGCKSNFPAGIGGVIDE